MCFSAGASFTASSVLAVIGVASVSKAKAPSQILFTSIPFLFAFQQLVEGYLWIELTVPTHTSEVKIATNIFLTFAQVVWPIWIPLGIALVERNKTRKKLLLIVTGIGLVVSISRGYYFLFHTAHASIAGHHVSYDIDGSATLIGIGSTLYFIVTVFPSFISSVKKMWVVGFLILFSFLISKFYFDQYLISVWCFFAALVSFLIYFITKNQFNSTSSND